MNKTKRSAVSILMTFALFFMLFPSLGMAAASAEREQNANVTTKEQSYNEARGLFAILDIFIDSDGDHILGRVKNTFTLFPSTIVVYLELYSSEVYTEDHTQMTLEGNNMTYDLNQGEVLEVRASTGGRQKYWKARMRYQFDDRDWVEDETRSILYSADGECLS